MSHPKVEHALAYQGNLTCKLTKSKLGSDAFETTEHVAEQDKYENFLDILLHLATMHSYNHALQSRYDHNKRKHFD